MGCLLITVFVVRGAGSVSEALGEGWGVARLFAVGVHSAAGFFLVAAAVGLLAHKYGPQDDAKPSAKVAPAATQYDAARLLQANHRGRASRRAHQNAEPVTYAATVVPQPQTIAVTIPPNTGPGSVLNCPLPDGRTVQVTVPPGSAPGAVIQVAVPP